MSVKEKMTAIADAIRSLLGITESMGIDAMASKLNNIPRQGHKTVTPSTSGQTVVTPGRYVTGYIQVAAIPSQYVDTSDATVTPDDMPAGITAYANGEKVTGNLRIAYGGIYAELTAEKAPGMPFVQMVYTLSEPSVIKPEYGDQIRLVAPFTDFGDAAPEDVVAGKTFTSASGFQAIGTKPEPVAETWVLTLADGSTVEKVVYVG